MQIKASESQAARAATLPRALYDQFKLAMFQLAYKLRLRESHDKTLAFADALDDTQDRRNAAEMTGFWLWYRRFYLPRKYRKLWAAMQDVNKEGV